MRQIMLFLLALSLLAGSARTDSPLRVMAACSFHGREWATSELCRHWQSFASNRTSPSLVEWSFVHEVNSFGTKAARYNSDECSRTNGRGVDLNRNWPAVPADRCRGAALHPHEARFVGHEAHPGEFPLSEPESRDLEERIVAFAPDVLLLVHTGEEAVIVPYDGCWAPPKDKEHHSAQLQLARWLAAEAVSNVTHSVRTGEEMRHAPIEKVGAGFQTMYPARGTLMDYAYESLGVPFPMTLETYRTPRSCFEGDAERLASFLELPTDGMSREDCTLTFVPQRYSDCRAGLSEYLERWGSVASAFEDMVSHARSRSILESWLGRRLAGPMSSSYSSNATNAKN